LALRVFIARSCCPSAESMASNSIADWQEKLADARKALDLVG
jgi:hypothetical protein